MNSNRKQRSGFSGLKEILPDVLPGDESGKEPSVARLEYLWSLTVGREIAGVTRVQKLEGNTLHVTVCDEHWKRAVLPLLGKIVGQLNREDRSYAITAIAVRVGRVSKAPAQLKPAWIPAGSLKPSSEIPGNMTPHLDTIHDTELKQILQRLQRKFGFVSWIAVAFLWVFTANCATLPRDP